MYMYFNHNIVLKRKTLVLNFVLVLKNHRFTSLPAILYSGTFYGIFFCHVYRLKMGISIAFLCSLVVF